MKRGKIEEGIRKLEAEIGAELVYAIFDTKEFIYRLNMYDKLVRDILDYPHEVLLQAKELSHTLTPKEGFLKINIPLFYKILRSKCVGLSTQA